MGSVIHWDGRRNSLFAIFSSLTSGGNDTYTLLRARLAVKVEKLDIPQLMSMHVANGDQATCAMNTSAIELLNTGAFTKLDPTVYM